MTEKLVKFISATISFMGSILVGQALVKRLESDPSIPLPFTVFVLAIQFGLMILGSMFSYQMIREILRGNE